MALIEVKYYNSFTLRKSVDADNGINWFGSRGIPTGQGGWPQGTVADPQQDVNWAIEESRIRGGYNNTSTSFGAKAYLVEDEPNGSVRGNAMIYSGIYNSRTGINQTNQFSVGKEITKAIDPANGSIQKLYAEDSNLIILSENKASRALIDKDAIYTAEGGGVSVSNLKTVIGQIVPYAGNFGIGTNPESFATYGYRKYFVDKNRGAVLRLSMDGITEISNYGMIDWFRDNLSSVDSSSFGPGKIVGGWDIYTKQYTLSLQPSTPPNATPDNSSYNTLQFDESVRGWPSFFTFKPRFTFSLANKMYSIGNQSGSDNKLYVHNSTNVPRGEFYGDSNKSKVTFVVNPNIDTSKVFKTINYEGSSGWEVTQYVSDITGVDSYELDTSGNPIWINPPQLRDTSNQIYSYYEGEYIINPITASPTYNQPVYRSNYVSVFGSNNPPYNRDYAGFIRKENKYYANLVNDSDGQTMPGEVIFGDDMTGIKGYYCTVTLQNDDNTDPGGTKELFAVNSTFVVSS
jgi:hypothetical protein